MTMTTSMNGKTDAHTRAAQVATLSSRDAVGIFLGDRSMQVRCAVASHALIDDPMRNVLARDRDAVVREALVPNHRVRDVIELLIVDPDERVRLAVASGTGLTDTEALRLARDESATVRSAVIQRYALSVVFDPSDILWFAAKHPRDLDERLGLPLRREWPSIIFSDDHCLALRATLTVLCKRMRVLDDLLWDETSPQPLRHAALTNPRSGRRDDVSSFVA